MCGIVGVIAKHKGGLFKAHITIFAQMLFADQLRGTDGTGIFYDTKEGIKVTKAPYEANRFFALKSFDTACEEAVQQGHFLVGHNRAATKGEKVWKDTHPFKEGNITLIHNGTLFSHKKLADVEVDSHAICTHMAKNGKEATLKEVDGAFALVWADEVEGTLNLARNNQRPLFLLETSSIWIICSEEFLGRWIADRNQMIIISCTSLESEHVYTFEGHDYSKYTKTKVEYFKWSNPVKYWGGGYQQGHDNPQEHNKGKHKKNRHLHPAPTPPKILTSPSTQMALTSQVSVGNKVIRLFGTKVQFKPKRMAKMSPSDELLSSILFDDTRQSNFLLGKIDGEPLTEVRVYAKYKNLVEFSDWDDLEATITSTVVRGGKTVYTVENVCNPSTGDLITSNTSPQNHKGECVCTFCTAFVPADRIQKFNGMSLCPECFETFTEEPHLAHEMGYC